MYTLLIPFCIYVKIIAFHELKFLPPRQVSRFLTSIIYIISDSDFLQESALSKACFHHAWNMFNSNNFILYCQLVRHRHIHTGIYIFTHTINIYTYFYIFIDLSSIQPMVWPPHPGASVIAPRHRVLAGKGESAGRVNAEGTSPLMFCKVCLHVFFP